MRQVFVCVTGQPFDAGFGGVTTESLLAPVPGGAGNEVPETNSADTIVGGVGAGRTFGTYVATIANPNYDPGPDGYPGTADDPAGAPMSNLLS